jgi:hypothetical protein
MALSTETDKQLKVALESMSTTTEGGSTEVNSYITDLCNASVKNITAHLPVLATLNASSASPATKLGVLRCSLRLPVLTGLDAIVRSADFRKSTIAAITAVAQALIIACGQHSSSFCLTNDNSCRPHVVLYNHIADPSNGVSTFNVRGKQSKWRKAFSKRMLAALSLAGVFHSSLREHVRSLEVVALNMFMSAITADAPTAEQHTRNVGVLVRKSFERNLKKENFHKVVEQVNEMGADITDELAASIPEKRYNNVVTLLTALDIVSALILRPLEFSAHKVHKGGTVAEAVGSTDANGSNKRKVACEDKDENTEDNESSANAQSVPARVGIKKKNK